MRDWGKYRGQLRLGIEMQSIKTEEQRAHTFTITLQQATPSNDRPRRMRQAEMPALNMPTNKLPIVHATFRHPLMRFAYLLLSLMNSWELQGIGLQTKPSNRRYYFRGWAYKRSLEKAKPQPLSDGRTRNRWRSLDDCSVVFFCPVLSLGE
jgi:hypothetical protein